MDFKSEPVENNYDVGEQIGSGQFAIVRRITHKETNVEYAGKFVRKRRARASRRGVAREDIEREIEILLKINHKHIIKLYEVYENKQDVILVLELVSGGELFEFLARRERVSEDEAVQFMVQILEGVKYLHDNDMVHLDLKPENVMLLDCESYNIKLIDFGLTRVIRKGDIVTEMMGTPEFVAPEVINYDPITSATDMWSIGVITYILLSGCSPFLGDNKQETFENVTVGEYSLNHSSFENTSDLAKDFIKKLLVRNPNARATVIDCLEHPWIKPKKASEKASRRSSSINVENLKSYIASMRWKHSIRVVQICNRLQKKHPRRLDGEFSPTLVAQATIMHREEEEEACRVVFGTKDDFATSSESSFPS